MCHPKRNGKPCSPRWKVNRLRASFSSQRQVGIKNSNGTDDFGFSALPVGYRKGDGYYVDGDKTLFWSSTEDGNFDAFSMLLSNTVHREELAELYYNIKGYGFSVRCVKD
nr:FISUMP domain-containing protein [uncultured Fibrobacter sp.]